ncbi:integral membrane protein DUF106-domain-containing protein [Cantharellus anzutake]|uniref:integral membrane protein DUF106-domain-containing protein n=1 Tax=Cantharellus anzutake TaxID=1750568 RepID=UPI001907C653|nr:integral membrane protein DUF106-domain-containing protein [Cantharellus anzutake]KAF8311326.1 integral membrane protein DUF106-domain-containing protein [Cantharellus anzutake]
MRKAFRNVSLYLNPQIRDWVLFPITRVIILVGILRHYVALLNSPPKKHFHCIPTRHFLVAHRTIIRRAISCSQILRATSTSSPLPPHPYRTISSHLCIAFTEGTYLNENPPKTFADPGAMDGMVEGLKKQMVMMVPQMLIMGWINFFFQGFVLIKLPFPLTLGFKSMMQRGIKTLDMDVQNAADSTPDMAAHSVPCSIGPGAPGYKKLFAHEKDNLQFAEEQYKWVCDGVETGVLEQWGKIRAIK